MNLLKENNLYDVQDIFKTRNNLCLKDLANYDSNNVNILGGTLETDHFRLNTYNSNRDTLIQCDATGKLVLNYDNSSNIPSWLRANIKDINVSIFNNDLSVLTYSTLCNIAISGDFNDLMSKPYLWDYLNSNEYSKIDENLSDIYNINNFYNVLNLSLFAKCNLTPTMEFKNVSVGQLTLSFLIDDDGLLDHSYNNILAINNIPFADLNTFGLGLLKNEPNTLTDTITSYHLNSIYEDLYGIYTSKNTNYQSNVAEVIAYIQSYKNDFVHFTSNLTDVDINEVKTKLQLVNILNKLVVYDDYIDFTDLTVNFNRNSYNTLMNMDVVNKINDKYVNIEDPLDVRSYHYFFLHIKDTVDLNEQSNISIKDDMDIKFLISTETIQYSDYPNASSNTLGLTFMFDDYNSLNMYNQQGTFNIDLFKNITNVHLEELDSVVDIIDFQAFLEQLYDTGTDNGSNLMKFSCNLSEVSHFDSNKRLLCYANLELEPIVYTSDYNTLFNTPNNVSCFSNDCEYISLYNNLNEFETIEEKAFVRSNLEVGTFGLQNIDNVNMFGSNLNFGFLTVNSTFSYHNDTFTNRFLYSSTSNGIAIWKDLPEYKSATSNEKGIVHMYDTLIYDENGAYTSRLLNSIYYELSYILNQKKNELFEIINHPNYLNYL